MHRFSFLIVAALLLSPAAFAGTDETVDASKGDDECYDRQGLAKPETNCICFVQKVDCGPASTCARKVCRMPACTGDDDCKNKFGNGYNCRDKSCKLH